MSTPIAHLAHPRGVPKNLIVRAREALDAVDFPKLHDTTLEMVAELENLPYFVQPIAVNCALLLAGSQEDARSVIAYLLPASEYCPPLSKEEKNIAVLYSMAVNKILSHRERIAIHQQMSREALAGSPMESAAKAGYMAELRATRQGPKHERKPGLAVIKGNGLNRSRPTSAAAKNQLKLLQVQSLRK